MTPTVSKPSVDLRQRGVDLTDVGVQAGTETGRAIILVDDHGENSIIVVSGANADLTGEHVAGILGVGRLGPGDVVLTSGEIGADCVIAAAHACAAAGSLHVHNMAPVRAFADIQQLTGLIVVNEVEMAALTGQHDADCGGSRPGLRAARSGRHPRTGGAVLAAGGRLNRIPAPVVDVVDTTGAGDAFCGVLAAEVALGSELEAAVRMAVLGGSAATQGAGARGALATRDDLVEGVI